MEEAEEAVAVEVLEPYLHLETLVEAEAMEVQEELVIMVQVKQDQLIVETVEVEDSRDMVQITVVEVEDQMVLQEEPVELH